MPENDTMVRKTPERKFNKFVKDCKLIKFKNAKHEILVETDDIRGNGVNVDTKNPKTAIDLLLSFFQIPVHGVNEI